MGGGGGIPNPVAAVTQAVAPVTSAVTRALPTALQATGSMTPAGLIGGKIGQMAGTKINDVGVGNLLGVSASMGPGGLLGGLLGKQLGEGLGFGPGKGGGEGANPIIQLKGIDQPKDIEFNSGLGPGGALQDQYKVNVGAMPQLNTQALDMMRQNATGQGLSSWGKAAMDQQQLAQKSAQDALAKNVNAGQVTAMNNLAMRGGLGAGARAMMGANAARDQMMQNQNLLGQGAQARAGILSQDAQTKQNMLSQLPGMELQSLDPQFRYMGMQNQANQFNTQNALNQLAAQNQFNMDKYKTGMSAWGANQQANAQLAGLNNQDKGLLGLGFMGL